MITRGYAVDQSPLYKLSNKRKLAELLKIEYPVLIHAKDWIKYTIEVEGVEKSTGGFRTIYKPCAKLKRIQSRIKVLLGRMSIPDWVFSGRKGVCHVQNGQYHEMSLYFIQSDLHAFYDSCSREYVFRFFKYTLKCSSDVSSILCDLTTYRFENGVTVIPSGSPCSQLLAFFAYRDMFNELNELAKRHNCKFSLYVDDITFSSRTPFGNPKSFKREISQTVKQFGHSLSLSKTSYRGASETKIITGVAVNPEGKSRIPNHLREKIVEGTAECSKGDLTGVLATNGRIDAARMIEPPAFPEAKRQVLLRLENRCLESPAKK